MTERQSRTGIADVGTVGIPVTDQDRALAFYTKTLGFEVQVDTPTPNGGRWIMLAPAGAKTSIALVQAHDGVPAGVETGIRFYTTDAAADHGDLSEAGVDVGELLQWPGVPPMFAFRDVDGNGLEIVQIP